MVVDLSKTNLVTADDFPHPRDTESFGAGFGGRDEE